MNICSQLDRVSQVLMCQYIQVITFVSMALMSAFLLARCYAMHPGILMYLLISVLRSVAQPGDGSNINLSNYLGGLLLKGRKVKNISETYCWWQSALMKWYRYSSEYIKDLECFVKQYLYGIVLAVGLRKYWLSFCIMTCSGICYNMSYYLYSCSFYLFVGACCTSIISNLSQCRSCCASVVLINWYCELESVSSIYYASICCRGYCYRCIWSTILYQYKANNNIQTNFNQYQMIFSLNQHLLVEQDYLVNNAKMIYILNRHQLLFELLIFLFLVSNFWMFGHYFSDK